MNNNNNRNGSKNFNPNEGPGGWGNHASGWGNPSDWGHPSDYNARRQTTNNGRTNLQQDGPFPRGDRQGCGSNNNNSYFNRNPHVQQGRRQDWGSYQNRNNNDQARAGRRHNNDSYNYNNNAFKRDRGYSVNNNYNKRPAMRQQESPFVAREADVVEQAPDPMIIAQDESRFAIKQEVDASLNLNTKDLDPNEHDPNEKIKRREAFSALMKKNLEDRLAEYKTLPPEMQLTLFFRTDFRDAVSIESLPPQEPLPLNWESKQTQAIEATRDYIGKMFDQDNDGNSSESSAGGMPCQVEDSEKTNLVKFLERLRFCQPMTIGFHAMYIAAAGNDAWCYCPCDEKHMWPWRTFCGVQHIVEEPCEFSKRKPIAFIAHLEQMKDRCRVHGVVYTYLCRLYSDYYEKGVRHIAFEKLNDAAYKRTEKVILRRMKHAFEKLEEEAKGKRELEAKLAKSEAERQTLKQVNQDLAERLDAKKEVRKRLNIKKPKEFDETRIPFFKRQYDRWRSQYCRPVVKREKVSVPQFFDLSELLATWWQNFLATRSLSPKPFLSFLFSSEPDERSFRKGISGWEIQFSSCCLDDDNTTQAKDKGGPTREFFSGVWRQVTNLKVNIPHQKPLELFQLGVDGLTPTTDDFIEHEVGRNSRKKKEREGLLEQIEAFYRAIGRLVAQCQLLPEESIPVASHIFPKLYQSVFIRDIDPGSAEYDKASLVDHACDLFEINDRQSKQGFIEDKEKETPEEKLLKRLGLEEPGDEISDEQEVRKKLKENFVEDRQIALSSLQNGLSLNNRVDWGVVFGFMPAEAVSKLVFSKPKLRLEDMFNKDGSFRFIIFKVEESNVQDRLSEAWRDTHELFKENLAELFRSMIETETGQTFINNFCYLATGMRYLPDIDATPDFKITIEFNYTEGVGEKFLPRCHTCSREVVLPVCAYGADMEEFQRLVDKTNELATGGFDME